MQKFPIYRGIQSTANMYRRQAAEGYHQGEPQVHGGQEGRQHRIHQVMN